MPHVVVNGLGRCGTSLVWRAVCRVRPPGLLPRLLPRLLPTSGFVRTLDELRARPAGTWKTHARPPGEVRLPALKVVYMFGNPMDVAVSVAQTSETFSRMHHENFHVPVPESRMRILHEDTLGLEAHFAGWARRQSVPLLTLRYDTLWEPRARAALDAFVGQPVHLEPYRPRSSDWKTHAERDALLRTYGPLAEAVEAADDVRVWDAVG